MPTSTISRCGGTVAGKWGVPVLELQPDTLWRLNETSGTTAFDSLTGHHDAFQVGGLVTWAANPAPTGDNAPFFALQQGFITTLATYAPILTGDFSAAVWMMRTTNDFQECFGQDSPNASKRGFSISMQELANPPGLRFFVEIGTGSAVNWLTSDSAITLGQWYWVVVTHSGTTWRMYVDGVLQANTYTGTYGAATDRRIWMGYSGSNVGQLGSFELSWAMLWQSRALSSSEIANVWAQL